MPTDQELLTKSELVVVGRVTAADRAPGLEPATDYTFEVSDLVKGFLPGTTIVIRELGGLSAAGNSRMVVLGSAPLSLDEEFVLFLEEKADTGTFRVMDLALGAFWHERSQNLALRALEGASEHRLHDDPLASERARSHLPRRFDRFVEWLHEQSDRSSAPAAATAADYFVEPSTLVGVDAAFNLTRSPEGNPPNGCPINFGSPVRWQEFDTQGQVVLLANQGGQPGVPGGGFTQIQEAVGVWSGVSGTRTNLVYGGTTPVTAAISGTDFLNTISFEDPNNQIAGSFPSAPSGTLMVTVVFFSCEIVHAYSGGVAHTLIEAGIVSQDGTGSFFFNAENFAEVIAHEIGHLYGIGHACGDPATGPCAGLQADALMRAFVHDDGRGARLNNDDRNALRALYPTVTNAPTAPTDLTATATSTTTIELAWSDNSGNETGFAIDQRNPPSAQFVFLGNTAPNATTATITGLSAESTAEFRIRSFRDGNFSDYSNTAAATTFGLPGPCVPDDNTLCLTDDRFEITIDFSTTQNTNGRGIANEITEDTGYFTFFEEDNVEVVVKVLNACVPFERFWVFAGGLTNVETTMRVVDTQTGNTRTYVNPQETPFQPLQDTDAFATCP